MYSTDSPHCGFLSAPKYTIPNIAIVQKPKANLRNHQGLIPFHTPTLLPPSFSFIIHIHASSLSSLVHATAPLSFSAIAALAFASIAAPLRLNPPLKNSNARIVELPVHNIQLKAANTASARAAAHTVPRQKRSLPRKTASAMKPAK